MNLLPMNVVIAVNPTYIPYAYVMLTSLLTHTVRPVHVYVLHHDLTASDEISLSRLAESNDISFHFLRIPDTLLPPAEVLSCTPWGIETYFRLTICDLLPADADRALYIDSDMIVNKSLDEFYFCDLGEKKIAACYDYHSVFPFEDYRDTLFCEFIAEDFHYFNAGLMLLDLAALRPQYSFQTYMDTAKKLNYQLQFPDQDLLNYCHIGDVLFFDYKRYNLFARRAYTDEQMRYADVKEHTAVVHYTNAKPWQGNCLHCDIEQLWWDYAVLTPFSHMLMEDALHQLMFDTTVREYIVNLQLEHHQLLDITKKYREILSHLGIYPRQEQDL